MQKPRSVLIIDDQIGIRALHAHLVRRIVPDVKILFAEDGRKALQIATEAKPDFIICDYAMPEMNGAELAERLFNNPETKSTPFLMITALESAANMQDLRFPTVVGVVRKPIQPGEMEQFLRKYIAKESGGSL